MRRAAPQGPPNHRRHLMRDFVSNGHIDSTWLPSTNGTPLGPPVLATDGVQLGIVGDLATVETEPQQSLGQLG